MHFLKPFYRYESSTLNADLYMYTQNVHVPLGESERWHIRLEDIYTRPSISIISVGTGLTALLAGGSIVYPVAMEV